MSNIDNGVKLKKIESGEPCGHPGCLQHSSHPCEGCGRINGKGEVVLIDKELRS